MDHFGEFLKTWSLRSNSVTRQVSFNRTKIGGKCQNLNATFWVIFKQCDSVVIFFSFSWHGCLFSPRRMRRMSGWKDAAKLRWRSILHHLSHSIVFRRPRNATRNSSSSSDVVGPNAFEWQHLMTGLRWKTSALQLHTCRLIWMFRKSV